MEYEKTAFFSGVHYRDGQYAETRDCLAEEVPVALEYNGLSHAVMLATPGDLEDFALGFSLTEGIVVDASELYSCEVWKQTDGIRVAIEIASERFHGLKEKRRNLTGRTGCGLCGTESLEQAVKPLQQVNATASFTSAQLHAGFSGMEALQALRKQTGATHAAAWMDAAGRITLVREDVGRHNALDKLIGALVKQEAMLSSGAVLVTSRASYEMVQKCMSVGIGILAAVSAPTALAVRMADKANLTLAGFVRENSHTIYTHPERLR
ncbi:formate dehydrogenase accessory sulfurtransferase FdhD [Oxalobacter vibrioformis]|uniref:Sulfur carrier protein FdhD n=1 Tax=Oxalobacter vibrioformis TaxID=933080 RepID=A0A9E9LXL1_9BURK|nr:formate dehydrogenase accessory sulfurtransferase FdhD [Oxalobacter vibrioformis]WAW09337.1 formate dehydrogenase accessory sulfurtransferase FdhD [Oxalobacter vibrioformis]